MTATNEIYKNLLAREKALVNELQVVRSKLNAIRKKVAAKVTDPVTAVVAAITKPVRAVFPIRDRDQEQKDFIAKNKVKIDEGRAKRWRNGLLETGRAQIRLLDALQSILSEESRNSKDGKEVMAPASDYTCRTRGLEDGCSVYMPEDPKKRSRFLFLQNGFERIDQSKEAIVLIESKHPDSTYNLQNAYKGPSDLVYSDAALQVAIRQARRNRHFILSGLSAAQRAAYFAAAKERIENEDYYDDFDPSKQVEILIEESALITSLKPPMIGGKSCTCLVKNRF